MKLNETKNHLNKELYKKLEEEKANVLKLLSREHEMVVNCQEKKVKKYKIKKERMYFFLLTIQANKFLGKFLGTEQKMVPCTK